jgi:signal transduction histidine kinase
MPHRVSAPYRAIVGTSATAARPPGTPTGTRRPSVRTWAIDVGVAIVVAAIQVAGVALAGAHQPDRASLGPVGIALLVTAAAGLVVHRHRPGVAFGVAFVATMAYVATDQPKGPAFLALIVAFFAAYLRGLRIAVLGALVLGYAWSIWLAPVVTGDPLPSIAETVGLAAWLTVLAAAAELIRVRRERTAEAARIRDEETRRQASEERLLIAQELHDVLAHNISLISVQAGVALHLIDERPEQARPALAAIKDASRDALDELRSVLDVLRQGQAAPRAPTSGIRDLDSLVERTRATGLDVRLEIVGTPRPLPTDVDLAALRIVQEALTNVVRHADAEHATVRVTYDDEQVTVQVEDTGRAPQPRVPTAAPPAGAPGRGLAGMRERAQAVGGSFHAAPRPGRGFRVRATLPRPTGDSAPEGDPADGAAAGSRRDDHGAPA